MTELKSYQVLIDDNNGETKAISNEFLSAATKQALTELQRNAQRLHMQIYFDHQKEINGSQPAMDDPYAKYLGQIQFETNNKQANRIGAILLANAKADQPGLSRDDTEIIVLNYIMAIDNFVNNKQA